MILIISNISQLNLEPGEEFIKGLYRTCYADFGLKSLQDKGLSPKAKPSDLFSSNQLTAMRPRFSNVV